MPCAANSENVQTRVDEDPSKEPPMDPITPHLDHEQRHARRQRLDGLIQQSAMKVPGTMRTLGRQVFADGAISKKHKELTALAVAVSQNCFD